MPTMRHLISLFLLALFLFSPLMTAPLTALEIRSDERIELCSLVFFLAGAPEYSRCCLPSYLELVKKRFEPFRTHPLIPFVQKIRQEQGISYDAVMSAAVAFQSVATMTPLIDLETRIAEIDARWTPEHFSRFLVLLADFAGKSRFSVFFQEQRSFFTQTEETLRTIVKKDQLESWFTKSFPGVDSGFVLIPAFLNGPLCYGPGLKIDGKQYSFSILGVSHVDANGAPSFSEGEIETVFHEFCHSHTNPLVDKHYPQLEEAAKKLFSFGEEEFSRQAYTEPRTVMIESLVRACTGAFMKEVFPNATYEAFIHSEEKNFFFWIRPLSEVVIRLREQGIPLEQGFPEIVAAMNDYSEHADTHIEAIKATWEQEMKAIAAKSPKVLDASIKDGAADVSTGIATFVMKFDRVMATTSWAILNTPDKPEIPGKPSFDSSGMVFSLPLKLYPEKSYTLQFNSMQLAGFKDAEGNMLFPTTIRFTTRMMTPEEVKQQDEQRPKILVLTPANNQEQVSPKTDRICIEFDQPMANSWALVGGGDPFPEITGEVSFDPAKKILTVPVRLKPSHQYRLWLNSDSFKSFLGENGIPLAPVKYQFKTGE